MIGNSGDRLSFNQYIEGCRKSLQERHLFQRGISPKLLVETNCPFELKPAKPLYDKGKLKYGVLLVHGLFDSPFSVRDIAHYLQKQGMLCRAVLLPGHGTYPDDLLTTAYQEWIETVEFGIDSFKDKVENIILVGYSTGAALAAYHALNNPAIKAVVMIAPLVQIKAPIGRLVHWNTIAKWFNNYKQWLVKEDETDYVKYTSITFNSVKQVAHLATLVKTIQSKKELTCPIFIALSNEDKVISSKEAIKLFQHYNNPHSELLLYTVRKRHFEDKRIIVRYSHFPELNINGFSHIALPFSPANPHYGQHGDFVHASLLDQQMMYGTYGYLQMHLFEMLHKLKVIKTQRRKLTYNPDFDFMAERISQFILTL